MNDQEFLQDILTESDYLPDMTGAVENHGESHVLNAPRTGIASDTNQVMKHCLRPLKHTKAVSTNSHTL